MNSRERDLATMNFRQTDRYPYFELGIWGQTYERWLKEGLSEDELKGDWFRGEPKFTHLDRRDFIKLDMGPIPGFEKIIEETDRYIIFIDRWGQRRRGLKEGTVRDTRLSMDTYIDAFTFNEDFAYKTGPLISPNIYRKFFLPRHRKIVEFLRKYGVKVIQLDSDGNTEVLIPLLIEAGINCHWPLEVVAGMDPVKIYKEYGRDLALIGGIDKRVLAKDKRAIESEVRKKIVPMLETGGYIPTVDHLVPPDVPLENFLYYLELKRKVAEGK